MQAFPIDQLRSFVTVVDAGSLTAGAPRVHLSQSAVSDQLRKLEDQAGCKLLLRSKTGVVPTEAGTRLLHWGRRLLALSEEAFRDLHGTGLQGDLRLGVTDYFRPAELAGLLARLQAQYPAVRLQVSVQKSAKVEAAYQRGELDVGLTLRLPGAGTSLPGLLLRQEPLLWMAAPGLRPTQGEALRLLALPDTCSLHQFTVALLARRRIAFAVMHQASGVSGLQSALAAGLGVACLNESALCSGVQRLVAPHGLPALPQAQFVLLAPHKGESHFVTQARQLLAAAFA